MFHAPYKPLWAAIGEPDSSLCVSRRCLAGRAIERSGLFGDLAAHSRVANLLEADDVSVPGQSSRRAVIGSMRLARRAGT
jgi:hypothetical protein